MSFTLLTVCTTKQLPEAIQLGHSIKQFHSDANVVIGLADEVPTGASDLGFPLISVLEVLGAEEVDRLSAQYTATEFVAAVKPALLNEVYNRFSSYEVILFAEPTVCFFQPLSPILDQLQTGNLLLTPYLTAPPRDQYFPDEKHFQNIGLYCSGFLALRRSRESERFLSWWDSRVRTRAFINFCEGLCTDQIWLMHVPAFFEGVRIIHDRTWHAALWNFHERPLQQTNRGWQINEHGPLLFANFKGLTNPDEGFFPHQTRLPIRKRPDIQQLLSKYQQQVKTYQKTYFSKPPSFGKQLEQPILRGWRKFSVDSLQKINAVIDTMPIPVLKN